MPTPTYTLIQEQVLGSAAATVTFSSIPGTYKDLVLEAIPSGASTNGQMNVTFNGDTGNWYSWTRLEGDGTTAASGRSSSQANLYLGYSYSARPVMLLVNVFSYANTNVNKSLTSRYMDATTQTWANAALYRKTDALTSMTVTHGAGTFNIGSTFRLWGVAG